jgi:hypothetical protein
VESDKVQTLPPPPGVIGSLKAGFDVIASNLPAILLPLAFDIVLWLGPRLRIDRLFSSLFNELSQYALRSGFPTTDVLTIQEAYTEIFSRLQQYNLLGILRTFPIGVFSLMNGKMPLTTPYGTPIVFQIDSIQTLLFWIGVLTFVGWLAGSLFFHWVASIVADSSHFIGVRFGNDILQTVILSAVWITLVTMIGLPSLILMAFIIAASPLMANMVLLIAGLLSMWLVVPAFFTPHGIYLQQQNAFSSIYASFRMARFTLPTSSLFVISVLIIAYGLNYLWNIPSPNSWITLVGIAGHAFITTSLLAASFIYYRDMHAWLQTVLEKFKANLPTGQA